MTLKQQPKPERVELGQVWLDSCEPTTALLVVHEIVGTDDGSRYVWLSSQWDGVWESELLAAPAWVYLGTLDPALRRVEP